MKRFATLLFMTLGSFGLAIGQSSFTVSANEVWTVANESESDVEGHIVIHNTTNSVDTIRWERTEISITNGCQSQVCDINLCYIPTVSTKTFNLAANADGNIIMHFLNPNNTSGAGGIFHLKFTNVHTPSDSLTVTYLFTSDLSGTGEHRPAANVKLFPNPTTDYFQLDNADAVKQVRVFALDSREVARYTATPGKQYALAGLPAGTYVLALDDAKGQAFQALEVIKR